MKVKLKPKNTSHSNLQASSKPFFNKSKKGIFYPKPEEVQPPFFTPSHVQTKLATKKSGDKQEVNSIVDKTTPISKNYNSPTSIQKKEKESHPKLNIQSLALDSQVSDNLIQKKPKKGQKTISNEKTHIIQKQEDDTLNSCPPYYGFETPRSIETYNCAGLAHRSYDYKGLQATSKLLSTNGKRGNNCNKGEVKHWLWLYQVHIEDYQGNRLSRPARDFHTVAGVVGPNGDPTDVYSKNGKRFIEGPGTGPSFKPPKKAQARENNASAKLATDPQGKPIYKIRTNMKELTFCMPCPI